jgi:hypothetical protein
MLFISSLKGEVVTVKDVLLYDPYLTTRCNLTGPFDIVVGRCLGKPDAYRAKTAYLMTLASRMVAGARSRAGIIETLKKVSPQKN